MPVVMVLVKMAYWVECGSRSVMVMLYGRGLGRGACGGGPISWLVVLVISFLSVLQGWEATVGTLRVSLKFTYALSPTCCT